MITSTHVEKLKFQKSNRSDHTAAAVEYWKGGQKRSVVAQEEIILAAGVFGCRQIHERSEFGNRAHLEPLEIDILFENDGIGGESYKTN